MRSRKDFYKYNVILAFAVFFMILVHIDNASNTSNRSEVSRATPLPNFAPTRYVASAQKARQEIYITLSPQKSDTANFYTVKVSVESSSLASNTLNYRWILAPGQELLSGSLTGTFIPQQEEFLSVRVKINDQAEKSRIRIEVFAEVNGTKIGNVQSTDLKAAPTESAVQQQAHIESQNKIQSAPKTKKELIDEVLASEPRHKIMQ